jgi:hypothetical protein
LTPESNKQLLAALGVALTALIAVGCGGKAVDDNLTERATADELARVLNLDITSVDCPSDVKPEPQERFTCDVRADGASALLTAELKILNEEGKLQVVEVRD